MGPAARKMAILLVGMAVVFTVVSALSEAGLSRVGALEAEVARMQRLNAELEAENARLTLRIEALRHDDETIERVAREELGLVRPGEVVFRFVPAGGPVP